MDNIRVFVVTVLSLGALSVGLTIALAFLQ